MSPRRRALSSLLLVLAASAAGSARAGEAGGTVTGKVAATPAKYLAETVVYLEAVPGSWPARTHQMDQQGMSFVPHLLIVTVGDTVKFTNHDGVAHNVYSPDGDAYNLGSFKTDEERSRVFSAPGAYTQLCSIHPEMLGYVLVTKNPFAAVVDAQGRFTLEGVPPGTYQLKAWNPHLPALTRSVTVAAGETATLDLQLHR
jgi:plastocyanin